MTLLSQPHASSSEPTAGTEPRDYDERSAELAALVSGRRSVRKLLADPVPRELIERAIEAAGWAPSPHGRQPWRFPVVESDTCKQALASAMASAWQEQLQLDGQDVAVIQIRLQKSLDRVTGAPVIIVPCLYLDDLDDYPDAVRREAERTMAVQSLGAAIQNLLLTVFAAGYDAGWMCGPLFCPDVVRDALGLSKSLIPHAMIPVGKAAADPVRRPRISVDDLIAQWL
jgi:F420 biosynthesis protein FbiB-like protein